MSILATISIKPILLLTLRGGSLPIRGFVRLLGAAAEVRGSAITTAYLTAMGLSDRPPSRGERRDDW